MTKKLDGKVAIVTGAASGMGKAIAELYAAEGAKVVAADFDADSLKRVVDGIKAADGNVSAVVTDMSKSDDIANMVDFAVKTYGTIDILVNNAGIMDNFKTVATVDKDLWDRIMAVNLTGPFLAIHDAVKIMHNNPNGGVIVNNASIGGLGGSWGGAAYVASKHGLVGLTQNIAATLGMFSNIRANAIAPGGVNTNIAKTLTDIDPMGIKATGDPSNNPMGEPKDIAKLALFLGSDDSKFINGTTVTADGGVTA